MSPDIQREMLDPFDATTMDITCRRSLDWSPMFNIPQRHVHHSTTGMEFGYRGSGPADFALNVMARFITAMEITDGRRVKLWDGSRVPQVAWDLHQAFTQEFIERLPREGGTIAGDVVRRWIVDQLGGHDA